ncbi:exodeoxyribonuclease VII small subunit [Deinococcus psychrotolerans]|uniref:Exodeoxyribonuclease VII small subunit n=1 Tax=Deinococcus psychrotolerans TaxID=2489213 RepID=A0A3G8YCA3_9DEIO|nr:exodeoxyribonuclease VII small subunit [Deinococcus psychrotolerans]AZI43012.1 exodeoxyribonuclease VII small subunit [Deinococcus psychrotolerans]
MSARKAPVGAAKTQSYRAAYQQLTSIAAELEAGETDLDKVLPLLTQAQAAYEICRERIDALRAALDEAAPLETVPLAAELGQDAADSAETEEDDTDDDDDVYF